MRCRVDICGSIVGVRSVGRVLDGEQSTGSSLPKGTIVGGSRARNGGSRGVSAEEAREVARRGHIASHVGAGSESAATLFGSRRALFTSNVPLFGRPCVGVGAESSARVARAWLAPSDQRAVDVCLAGGRELPERALPPLPPAALFGFSPAASMTKRANSRDARWGCPGARPGAQTGKAYG
ncbi:hypothetical protein BOTBODRAFT_638164 [Botryobasidium botryosum FD-172 SS1]|uniref:Uncharacterized protein n=1 Tax=Botryobasidium botryosum (strain FD-172 SS1) TaxID=930990 RepID=A0A067MGT5_BOTB1|nr:hypothetical protein BOTBODRAFT_638164 [Botryobasidium botryosum FD-172 SS1]